MGFWLFHPLRVGPNPEGPAGLQALSLCPISFLPFLQPHWFLHKIKLDIK